MKRFLITITQMEDSNINITANGDGFTDAEKIGFLEIMKDQILRSIASKQQEPTQ